jgi:hypothetical protein
MTLKSLRYFLFTYCYSIFYIIFGCGTYDCLLPTPNNVSETIRLVAPMTPQYYMIKLE